MAKSKKASQTTRTKQAHGTGAEVHDGSSDGRPQTGTALLRKNDGSIASVQYTVIGGDCVFEGDIVLGTVDQVERENEIIRAEMRGDLERGVIISGDEFRWPQCVVPYDIDASLTNQARVTDAIAHWENNTRFKFVLRTTANASQYPDWVTFRPASGCSSSVGRRGGQQFVNLGAGCSTGNTIHEIGHVIGLWHEQSREDRDAFVTINWENILEGHEHNFNQHISDGDDVGAYDYGSIMHYPRTAFSANGLDTITPTTPGVTIGQRTALSAGDIAAANSMCPMIAKARFPETVKERFPETIKERLPETIKERLPETTKERFPETAKELIPETAKERIPETTKELVEGTRPVPGIERLPGRVGELPFAMRVPSRGAAFDAQSGAGVETDYIHQLALVIEQMQADLAALIDEYDALVGAQRRG